jgi:phage gp36-like protein
MPYLTKAEYLERFDEAETISLTDPDGVEVGDERLEAALQAASDWFDTYAATRYSLPLDPVPSSVKTVVGDLAREGLFTLRPTDEVTARADRARAWLRDLAKGIVELVGITGALVDEGASDEPIVYVPDQIFTDERLSLFRGRMQ